MMTSLSRKDLSRKIYEISHLKGQFKLRSGQVSQEYFDKYRFESQPELLAEIAKQMAPMIPAGTEILAGLELGGVPVATALSLHTGLPVVFVRKKAKDYGTCQFAEGIDIKNKTLCVIEDVITTGGQVLLSAQDLRQSGAKVKDVLCVIYRGPQPEVALSGEGLKMQSLFTAEELKNSTKA